MPVDVLAAERFVHESARLLDRHRVASLLHGEPADAALLALSAYRNADGGFGHALEPDVRGPESETTSTLQALEVLAELRRLDDAMLTGAAAWIAEVADADGGVPFVLASTAAHPHAPWMVPSAGGSQITFALLARLYEASPAGGPMLVAGAVGDWRARAEEWCWERLSRPRDLSGYAVRFALDFLDHTPAEGRAAAALETIRPRLAPDGSIAVAGGTEDERLTALALSPRPGARSRALFADGQIGEQLDLLEGAQQADGGWTFDWLAWSPAQAVEWRGAVTLRALATLAAHRRIGPFPARERVPGN